MIRPFENNYRLVKPAVTVNLKERDMSFILFVEKFLEENILFLIFVNDKGVGPERPFWRCKSFEFP